MTLAFQSKSDLVADGIRDLIQRGELAPDEILRQRELAERFGVSPTPVREALRRLEAEGYVRSELHRGATVVRHADARVTENFLVRASLEGLAAELAARKISDEELASLEQWNAKLASCEPDEPARFDINRRFHFTIYEAADSPILISLLTLLWDSLDGGPSHGRPVHESVAEHADIIEALRSRAGRHAADLIRRHIQGGMEAEREHVASRRNDEPVASD